MSLADTITSAANTAAAIAVTAFPDLCSLIVPSGAAPDGYGGTSTTDVTVATGIKCLYEPLTKTMRVAGGARITTQTHRITMEATSATRLIREHYKIVVAPRSLPSLTFLNPVTMDGSFAPIVMIAAELPK